MCTTEILSQRTSTYLGYSNTNAYAWDALLFHFSVFISGSWVLFVALTGAFGSGYTRGVRTLRCTFESRQTSVARALGVQSRSRQIFFRGFGFCVAKPCRAMGTHTTIFFPSPFPACCVIPAFELYTCGSQGTSAAAVQALSFVIVTEGASVHLHVCALLCLRECCWMSSNT